MDKLKKLSKKYLYPFVNTRAAGLYILIFAAAIGVATFIENDYGTSAAQKVVYQSWWFSLILLLFGISIVANIFRFRMISQRKWALFTFHIAMIVILIGAAATRYLGYEGIMHIRENEQSSQFLTAETYLQFNVHKNGKTYRFDEEVLFASLGNNDWNESFLLGTDLIEVKVHEFIPNPKPHLVESKEEGPILKVVFGGIRGREEYFIAQGQRRRIRNTLFNFTNDEYPNAINIKLEGGELFINTDKSMTQNVMATQSKDTLSFGRGVYHPLKLRALYSNGKSSFVFGDFRLKGTVEVKSDDNKVTNRSMTCLRLDLKVNGKSNELFVYGMKGMKGKKVQSSIQGLDIEVAYGSKYVQLPFAIQLHDFMMERYPGTNNAASYASQVTLHDPRNDLQKDYRIYMNHILDHDGYRFFQSSFDKDELGTYLSVNHDRVGTIISYFGYFLLTIGMLLSFFSKKSRFQHISRQLESIRVRRYATAGMLILVLIGTSKAQAQKVISSTESGHYVNQEHAERVSKLVIQDHHGRMKPFHTFSREILRKLCRKEQIFELSADQVILGMFANSRDWLHVPLIKLGKHENFQQALGTTESIAAYSDFFAQDGQYLLKEDVRKAYNLEARERGAYDKELLKVDERVNIVNMVFSGHLLKLIPEPNDPNNSWSGSGNHGRRAGEATSGSISQKFFASYQPALKSAIASGDYTYVNSLIKELQQYQKETGGGILPSETQLEAEIILNQLNVFTRLSFFYLIVGLAFLIFTFYTVFKHGSFQKIYIALFSLMALGFAFHTIGLGLRWYVSERAPWSNGYESMIYIAWTTTLAGIMFGRRSFGALAATNVLAAIILLVALLSYMDPEITPLVPVLRSYWLTIHVSLEAGSYGFLMLGALIGLINLLLFIFLNNENKERIKQMIKEMSYLSEMTLIGGVFMISVGTYLGGVWANESWGRYWGWDAKETWALVTILVYAFILHMRIIPKMQSLFAYNFATIFGLASVIMTYYGVNYYLSGLHSYAAGDPVPIPQWVYMVVTGIGIITVLAYWKKNKYNLS